ncbi:Probable spore germination protein gerPC [Chlamydia abortus]|nr:Probable spore germination protein gerPC [Chlamydia abortus]
MYNDPWLMRWFQDVYTFLARQQEKIDRIEEMIIEIREDIREFKGNKMTHVERIEYHFDQLKVETLEGTLNIGLSPNGKDIEELSVPSNGEGNEAVPIFPKLKEQLDSYIDMEIPREVSRFETQYGVQLPDELRFAMIEDIRQQVGPRIVVYIQKLYKDSSDDTSVEKDIADRVKRDIRLAIEQFFQKKYGKGSEEI